PAAFDMRLAMPASHCPRFRNTGFACGNQRAEATLRQGWRRCGRGGASGLKPAKLKHRTMQVTFAKIQVGDLFSRSELTEAWGYASYHAIARGVVTPRGDNK